MSIPIGDRNVDLRILAGLPSNSRKKLCASSTYLNELCQSDDLWLIKLESFDEKDYKAYKSLSPKEIYTILVGDEQALDRFHQIIISTIIELDMDSLDMYDSQYRTTIMLIEKRGDILKLTLRQEDVGGGEVIQGNIKYNINTRKVKGKISVVGSPDENWKGKTIIQSFFRSKYVDI